MNYEVIYNANGEAVGIVIDDVFYKIVGITRTSGGQTTTVSTPNARVTTNDADPYSWEWYVENEGSLYTVKNAPTVNTVKTQEKSSFWTGFSADKLFTGIVSAVTSIFGNKAQTQTIDPSVYGTNPYLVQQPQSNTNNLILLAIGVFVIFFLFKGDNKKKD